MDFSTSTVIASFIISTIGFSYFMYGKKNSKMSSLLAGILMMGYPYFVHNVMYMTLIAGVLCVAPLLMSI